MYQLRRGAFIRSMATLLLMHGHAPAQKELIDNYLGSMQRLVTLMSEIKDLGTARGAKPKLSDGIAAYVALREQVRRLSFEERKERNKEMQESYVRLAGEVKRLRELGDVEKELHSTLSALD